MTASDLLLKLVITAKDEASVVFGKVRDSVAAAVKSALAFAGVTVSLQQAVQAAGSFEEQLGKVAVKGGYTAVQMAELTAGIEQIAAQFGATGVEVARGMGFARHNWRARIETSARNDCDSRGRG